MINDGWTFDPDPNEPPLSTMTERPPMTATGTHPNKTNHPAVWMFLSLCYIQQCHHANQVTRFLHQYFGSLTQAKSPSNHNPSPNAPVDIALSSSFS